MGSPRTEEEGEEEMVVVVMREGMRETYAGCLENFYFYDDLHDHDDDYCADDHRIYNNSSNCHGHDHQHGHGEIDDSDRSKKDLCAGTFS